MEEQEYLDAIARVTEERDDARAEMASASIDSEEIDALRASNATAEETLAALQTRLTDSEGARALSAFNTKRDKAIEVLGLPSDDPSIKLAFPDDAVLDDEIFASRIGSLKEIAALRDAPPPPPPPNLEEPGTEDWQNFGGPRSGDGQPPSEMTQAETQTLAQRAKYTETRNPRDLIGALGNKIMKLVSRKTPGGQTYYDKERVQ